jgi:hypothetical protein
MDLVSTLPTDLGCEHPRLPRSPVHEYTWTREIFVCQEIPLHGTDVKFNGSDDVSRVLVGCRLLAGGLRSP